MKKQVLILACSALILASCGSNNDAIQNVQAQMDSIARANAAQQDAINKRRNDSVINAMANAKADSIEKESRKAGAGEHKETPPAPSSSPVINRPGATVPKSDSSGVH